MKRSIDTQVLIVGGGPVGLTLGMDLGQRGVKLVIAELRHRAEPPPVKCNHVSARSMEIFRRLGVAKALRNSGLPPDYPNDVAYRTSFLGQELSRIPIPSRSERYTAREGPDTWWPTPEPPHRINQVYIEPVLFEHAERTPGLEIVNRTRVERFEQDQGGVTAHAIDLDGNGELQIRCAYLIGCDGGRSMVRKAIGARLSGTDVVGRVQSTCIRAPGLLERLAIKPAWATFAVNPRRCGNVYAIDGRQDWLVHNYLNANETDFDSIDRDWAIRQILGVDERFEYQVLSNEDWIGRRLVADRFRDRRVFICGDACHLWVPMAGYGMNAGIADAMNLSWLLAARLQGWATDAALDAYEIERQPITEQVSHFAMNHALALQRQREAVPEGIELPGPEGDEIRRVKGKSLYELNVQQYCCGGLNFGYFYDQSPLIAYDDDSPPAYTMDRFTPSTVPGCRTPHAWLSDGRSLYDAIGNGYTLIRTDPGIDVSPLTAAAEEAGVPLSVLDLSKTEAGPVYDRPLVLSRPDQHVAWRGHALPSDARWLVDLVRGAITPARQHAGVGA
jgi:2-polyprenyl-6-methoxyphenol hydroxylase-like FAD-dependent oxidoreductase